MYQIDQNTEQTFVSFTGGIQDNVVMTNAAFEPADKEQKQGKVLRFYFKGPLGQRHIETIFPVNKENTVEAAKRWNKDPKEVLQDEYAALAGKVQHILGAYIPKEQTFCTGATWEEFATNVLARLGQTYVNVPVRIKLVYNSKAYLSMPRKAVSPFIVKMADAAMITINPKWDKVVPPAQKEAVADPFAVTNTPNAADPAGMGTFGGEAEGTTDPFAF